MNTQIFFNEIRDNFRGKRLNSDQVKGIEGIMSAFNTHGDGKADTLAYALATVFHETGQRMMPVREGFATTDAGARRAVNNLAKKRGPNSAVAKYAKPDPVTGHVYYGRGYVQLTWKDNYAKSSKDAGVDLVKNPDAMLDSTISARVLIKGLLDGRWNGERKGLRFYLDRNDIIQARRTVNILDKAKDIADYYKFFLDALTKAGYSGNIKIENKVQNEVVKPVTPVVEEVVPVESVKVEEEPVKETKPISGYAAIAAVILIIILSLIGA